MPKRKRRANARKRKGGERPSQYIGFRAFYDTDPDILQWWKELAYGDGSERLRAIIRQAMGATMDKTDDVTQLSEQIEALRRELSAKMDQLIQQVASRPLAAPPEVEAEQPRISHDEQQKRTRNVLGNRW